MILERESNNTLATAQNLGGILPTGASSPTRTATIQGSMSNADTDFFRFLPGNQASNTLELKLSNPSGTISLYRDANFNRQIDAGEFIESSLGSPSNSIKLEGMGDDPYYVQVSKGGSSIANYSLDIKVTRGVGRESEPNSTPAQADDLGRLNGFRTFEGSINSTSDRSDYYHFRLDTSRRVGLSVSDPSFGTGNADLRLYRDTNNNNQFDASEIITVSANSGTRESISRTLAAGDYLVEVVGQSGSVNNYRMNMSALAV